MWTWRKFVYRFSMGFFLLFGMMSTFLPIWSDFDGDPLTIENSCAYVQLRTDTVQKALQANDRSIRRALPVSYWAMGFFAASDSNVNMHSHSSEHLPEVPKSPPPIRC
jgi:hypothetical protein